MRTRALLAALVLALLPAAAVPSWAQSPQAIVSPGWEGIWQVQEETRDCTTGALVSTASYLDTLCAGEAYYLMPGLYLDPGGYHYASCSGSGFTDTALNLSCSVGYQCGALCPCSAGLSRTVQWTRTGDEATTESTQSATYNGAPGCFPPSWCRRTTGTRTRIAPAPACGLTILASAGPNGSISPSGTVSVTSGGTQAFTITPDPGYLVAGVVVDGSEVGPVTSYTFTNVTSNHTIAASFTQPTILASAGLHGSIDPSGAVTVPGGGSQTFTITPDPGYAVAIVTVDGAEIGPVTSYTFTDVVANHTIAASFALAIGFELKPSILHLNFNEHYVTGYLTPPAPYGFDVDVATIRLNGVVAIAPGTDATVVGNALKVKFLRSELAPTLTVGSDVPVNVSGIIAGEPFAGTDVIDVRAPKVRLASSTLTAGTTTDVLWDVPAGSTPTVTLLSTFDGGSSWNIEAEGIANTGRYAWTVPGISTDAARLAVIQIFTTDETGVVTESEWAVSDLFAITTPLGVGGEAAAFALRPANPMSGSLAVRLSLLTGAPARLTAYDIGGREVAVREVGGVAGWRSVSLGRLPAGIYVLRLSQGRRSLSSRVVVVP